MSTIQLTSTQHFILDAAIKHTEGRIEQFPENVKGGARSKVLDGLFNRALITPDGEGWRVAAEGYDALNYPRPGINPKRMSAFEAKLDQVIANADAAAQATPDGTTDAVDDAAMEDAVASADASFAAHDAPRVPRTRENSKQAEVLRMLRRPEGATISQICESTGWQAHTVRGTFAGAFKKKLGLVLTSEKAAGAERVYRVA
jgi:hypothetical protein